MISIVDADGGVRYHSESVRRVLGYDPADLVDGDPLSLVHPDDRERVARFVAEAALRPRPPLAAPPPTTAPGFARRWPPTCSRTPTSAAWC